MKSDLYRADSAGRVRVPTAGIGLRVAPSVPDAGAPEFNKANQPGRLPLCARLDSAGGTRIAVPNSDALFMREPFGEVFLEGGEAGGWYAVTVFEAPNESVIPSALKTIVAVELMPAGTAVATAVPIASEGVPLRPGMRAVTTYFAGVLQAATLYVMKTDGTCIALDGRGYRPDLAGWRRERMPTMPSERPVALRPDWLCEIVSDSNRATDTVTKLRRYHQAGVPHYWILDQVDHTLTVYRHHPDGYLVSLRAEASERVRAEPFDAIELRVAVLFGDDPEEG